MCGIAGFYFHEANKRPFTRNQMEALTDFLLLEIENRGGHATGVSAMLPNGNLHLEKAAVKAGDYIKNRHGLPKRPQLVMLHTRFATQGEPSIKGNNHPVVYDDSIITHNGHISNDKELFESENLTRKFEVDSEIIAALIQKYGIENAKEALEKLDGTFATTLFDQRVPGTFVVGKGFQSPFHYFYSQDGVLIYASTSYAVQKACKEALNWEVAWGSIRSLNLGEMLVMKDGKAYISQFEPIEKKYNYTSAKSVPYGGSSHHHTNRTSTASISKPDSEKSKEYTVSLNSRTVVYRRCDNCGHGHDKEGMHKIGNDKFFFCDDCFTSEEESDQYDSNDFTEEIDRTLNEEHETVCQLVGEKLGMAASVVNWLLFEAEKQGVNFEEREQLKNLHDRVSDTYADIYVELMDDAEKMEEQKERLAIMPPKEEEEGDNGSLFESCGVASASGPGQDKWEWCVTHQVDITDSGDCPALLAGDGEPGSCSTVTILEDATGD